MGRRLESCAWSEGNTFHHCQFEDLGRLLELKRRAGKTVSVCLPSLNEASTIGPILETIVEELMTRVPLVDQLCVVDGGSKDGTIEQARKAGAEVYRQEEILSGRYAPQGKGDALWRSMYCMRGDIIIWMDSDIRNFHPRFVYGILGPLLTRPDIRFVKGFYQRPFRAEHRLLPTGGGRVTELVARPLLSLFYPELTALIQPLSGEYGGDRSLLESIPFFSGYGVEIGMLIDIYSRYGMEVIGQVDLEERHHRNQTLPALGRMAFQVMQAVLVRLQEEGRLSFSEGYRTEITQVDYRDGEYILDTRRLPVEERPPISQLQEYRALFGG
ncbi:MAG: glucosyl-3-phosphoglycerate synthase [Actinomycetota bacterium]